MREYRTLADCLDDKRVAGCGRVVARPLKASGALAPPAGEEPGGCDKNVTAHRLRGGRKDRFIAALRSQPATTPLLA